MEVMEDNQMISHRNKIDELAKEITARKENARKIYAKIKVPGNKEAQRIYCKIMGFKENLE